MFSKYWETSWIVNFPSCIEQFRLQFIRRHAWASSYSQPRLNCSTKTITVQQISPCPHPNNCHGESSSTIHIPIGLAVKQWIPIPGLEDVEDDGVRCDWRAQGPSTPRRERGWRVAKAEKVKMGMENSRVWGCNAVYIRWLLLWSHMS